MISGRLVDLLRVCCVRVSKIIYINIIPIYGHYSANYRST